MPTPNIDIRPVVSEEEYYAVEDVQRSAWPSESDTGIITFPFLITIQKNGGLLLGAFDGGKLIAFALSILGHTSAQQLKQHSHMLAVLPSYQSSAVGEQLKWAQREFALEQGLELITWTVDPLEGPNASLNFGKLGVVCNRYIPNLYGHMRDGLNKGMPSDRFEVDWQIAAQRADDHRKNSAAQRQKMEKDLAAALAINGLDWGEKFPRPSAAILDAEDDVLSVQVPPNIQAIKAHSIDLASEWRMHTRDIFIAYFAAGYTVGDFISLPANTGRQNTYLLRRDPNG